jgi:cytochrome P450
MRSIVSPALTLASVRNMNGVIWNIANAFQAKLAAHIATETSSQGAIIDLTHWMAVVTLEVIGRVAFNHDFELGDSKEAKLIVQGWHEQASAGLQPSGFVALVVLRTFPFITSLPVEAMQKQGETKQIVQKLARELVASSSLEGNTDILSLLGVYDRGLYHMHARKSLMTVLSSNRTTSSREA